MALAVSVQFTSYTYTLSNVQGAFICEQNVVSFPLGSASSISSADYSTGTSSPNASSMRADIDEVDVSIYSYTNV